jgi:phosphinothricin acetyltransferase
MNEQQTKSVISVRVARNDDAAAIADIYNQGITGRMATFETVLRTPADILATLAAGGRRYPYLVAEIDSEVVGWASVSTYRPRTCYAGIGEFSIYIDERVRGQGVGKVLLPALIAAAEEAGFWKLLSRVFPANTASRKLCAACGFREVGVYEKHAKLDGQWLDVVIVERLIEANLG